MDLHSLRERIGYVPQKGVLFSGTIDSNIRYGNDEAAPEEVERAAKIAQAWEFIQEKKTDWKMPLLRAERMCPEDRSSVCP